MFVMSSILMAGCSSANVQAATENLRVVGALDVLPVAQSVQQDFTRTTGLAVDIRPTTTGIQDVRQGLADVALLGYEPPMDELTGLEDHLIALDAVCLVINSRTFTGGLQTAYNNIGALAQPQTKYGGLQGLSLDELHGHMANILKKNKQPWQMQGTRAGYFSFQAYLDINGLPEEDLDHPGHALGTWVWNDVFLYGEALPVNKFDTQQALFQKLGFKESDLSNPQISFVPKILDSEEELISHRYKIDPEAAKEESDRPFSFFIDIASRRITTRAIQHGFALRALSIDGIDPLSDPHVIYDGTYPLSRKIHLIVRRPASHSAEVLLQFILSPDGQQLISRAGYLVLNPGQ